VPFAAFTRTRVFHAPRAPAVRAYPQLPYRRWFVTFATRIYCCVRRSFYDARPCSSQLFSCVPFCALQFHCVVTGCQFCYGSFWFGCYVHLHAAHCCGSRFYTGSRASSRTRWAGCTRALNTTTAPHAHLPLYIGSACAPLCWFTHVTHSCSNTHGSGSFHVCCGCTAFARLRHDFRINRLVLVSAPLDSTRFTPTGSFVHHAVAFACVCLARLPLFILPAVYVRVTCTRALRWFHQRFGSHYQHFFAVHFRFTDFARFCRYAHAIWFTRFAARCTHAHCGGCCDGTTPLHVTLPLPLPVAVATRFTLFCPRSWLLTWIATTRA